MQPWSNILTQSYNEKGTLACRMRVNYAQMNCQFTVPSLLRLISVSGSELGKILLLQMYMYIIVIKNTEI